jgi:hypothetical protein
MQLHVVEQSRFLIQPNGDPSVRINLVLTLVLESVTTVLVKLHSTCARWMVVQTEKVIRLSTVVSTLKTVASFFSPILARSSEKREQRGALKAPSYVLFYGKRL